MTATKKTNPKKTETAKKKAVKRKARTAAEGAEKKMSALDAAAKVLKEKGVAMTCPELIGVMAAKGYWSSPNGKTPAATLYAAILREVTVKGDNARFRKDAPGRFAAKDAPTPTAATATPETGKPAKKAKAKKPAKTPAQKAPIADGTPGPESVAELFRL